MVATLLLLTILVSRSGVYFSRLYFLSYRLPTVSSSVAFATTLPYWLSIPPAGLKITVFLGKEVVVLVRLMFGTTEFVV